MFKFLSKRSKSLVSAVSHVHIAGAMMEVLEDRQFLSASHGFYGGGQFGGPGGYGGQLSSIQFSQAPSAVQTGLDKLAESDGLTDPTSAQAVTLGNRDGLETYSVNFNSAGISTTLTVDQNGNPLTAPTTTTTTFGSLQSTDSAAATEIISIATALNLTGPASDTAITVTTTLTGTVIYSVDLAPASTTTTTPPTAAPVTMHMDQEYDYHNQLVSVDAAGNPVGNQNLPFSVIPSAIQAALNANAPSGATAYTTDSTQNVSVRTVDGVTTYSVAFSASGIYTTVTVDKNGHFTSLPSHTTTTFGALTMAIQTEIQTLATANNITTTIDATQTVDVLTESNGTIIYSVSLPTTSTTPGGRTFTRQLTISVDASGNPTVLPGGDGRGFRGDDGDGFGRGFGGHGEGCDGNRGGTTNSSGDNSGSAPTSSTGSSATAAVLTGSTSITSHHSKSSSKKPKPAPKPRHKGKSKKK